jgi:hypothetical protein
LRSLRKLRNQFWDRHLAGTGNESVSFERSSFKRALS